MTRSEFVQQAVIALASNPKMIADSLTIDQCINNIIAIAEGLTLKVEENSSFDYESPYEV